MGVGIVTQQVVLLLTIPEVDIRALVHVPVALLPIQLLAIVPTEAVEIRHMEYWMEFKVPGFSPGQH